MPGGFGTQPQAGPDSRSAESTSPAPPPEATCTSCCSPARPNGAPGRRPAALPRRRREAPATPTRSWPASISSTWTCSPRLVKPLGQRAGQHGEVHDAGDHQQHRHDLPVGRGDRLVAVPELGDGLQRPVDPVEVVLARLGQHERPRPGQHDQSREGGRVPQAEHRERHPQDGREAHQAQQPFVGLELGGEGKGPAPSGSLSGSEGSLGGRVWVVLL